MSTARIEGLYAITDPALTPDDHLLPAAIAALRGGARVLQYRDKHASADQRHRRAGQLRDLCHHHNALFIVNDDPALAAAVDADGVHIGQSDGALADARARLGDHGIIGVSCHGKLELARRAVDQGADYVALGRFFASHTKPQAPPASLDTLARACRELPVPVVAIGGITPDNAPHLMEQGARTLAVIHALFANATVGEVEQRARQFSQLLLQAGNTG